MNFTNWEGHNNAGPNERSFQRLTLVCASDFCRFAGVSSSRPFESMLGRFSVRCPPEGSLLPEEFSLDCLWSSSLPCILVRVDCLMGDTAVGDFGRELKWGGSLEMRGWILGLATGSRSSKEIAWAKLSFWRSGILGEAATLFCARASESTAWSFSSKSSDGASFLHCWRWLKPSSRRAM